MWNDRSCAPGRGLGSRLMAAGVLAMLGWAATSVPGVADDDRSDLARMLEAADQGEWPWAARLADGTGVPQLRSYVRWRELAESKEPPPFDVYAAFLRAGSDWPGLGTIQTRAEEAMDATVPFDERLAFFADRTPRTRQGRILYAEALIAADRRAEAVEYLRQAWIEDDFGEAEEQLFLDRFGADLGPASHVARLDRLLWDGRIDQARRMLPRVGPAERAQATTRLKLQQSDPGVEAALAALPAQARRDAGVMYDRLRWRRKNGSDAGVREILLSPPDELRRPELWWREQDKAIRAALAERSFKLAYRLASASRQKSGIPFTEAEWQAGWLALQFTGQPKAARKHFERLWPAVATPISRGRAGYWSGRAAAAVGASDAAATWYERAATYPNSFYGQLAAAEIGRDPSARIPEARAASPAARDALQRRTPAVLAALFCRSGQARYAQPFFRHLGYEAADDPQELAAVVELAQGCGRADLVLAATRGAAGNGTHLVREVLPPATDRRVPSRSRRHGGAGAGAGRGAAGEPVRPGGTQLGGCHGADAAHAGNGADGVARARRGLYARAAGARPGLQYPPGRLLSGPAARPLRPRARPGAGRLQCRPQPGRRSGWSSTATRAAAIPTGSSTGSS